MNKSWIPVVIVLSVALVVAFVIRQYGSRQSAPAGLTENGFVPTISQDPKTEAVVTPGITPYASDIQLLVTSPSGNITVSSSSLVVRGKTVSRGDVFVNDTETNADARGNFSVTITLDEGENYILVVANDSSGNYVEKEFTVTYNPK